VLGLLLVGATVQALVAPTSPRARTGTESPATSVAYAAEASVNVEVSRVKAVRPTLVAAVEAVKRGDLGAARVGVHAFDSGWNGIEVYVNVRNLDLYRELEIDTMAKLEEILDAPQPDKAEALPLAEKLLVKYDEVIALSEAGPALDPRFDDVAALRIVRANLREVTPALKANDLATARAAYFRFRMGWPEIEPLMQTQSPDTYHAVTEALPSADAAFQASSASAAELIPVADGLIGKYNAGVNALTAAAREAQQANQKPG
jgi:hypothetical protein